MLGLPKNSASGKIKMLFTFAGIHQVRSAAIRKPKFKLPPKWYSEGLAASWVPLSFQIRLNLLFFKRMLKRSYFRLSFAPQYSVGSIPTPRNDEWECGRNAWE